MRLGPTPRPQFRTARNLLGRRTPKQVKHRPEKPSFSRGAESAAIRLRKNAPESAAQIPPTEGAAEGKPASEERVVELSRYAAER
jgi:hypothetical protein